MGDPGDAPLLDGGDEVVCEGRDGTSRTYTIERLLKTGGGGRIYLAHGDDRATVVLKTSKWLDDASIHVEERILRQLAMHPNLINFWGGGDSAAGRVVVYERLHPNPLVVLGRARIRARFPGRSAYVPLPPALALECAVDLVRGVEFLHARGFAHFDIKPHNLMVRLGLTGLVTEADVLEEALDGEGRYVLIDVGGGRSLDYVEQFNRGELDEDVRVVPPQLTPRYAPPEALLKRETDYGFRRLLLPNFDVYSTGLVIYTMVSGLAPYEHLPSVGGPLDMDALKAGEARGEVSPLAYTGVVEAPGYRRLAGDLFAFLSACVDRDPAKRPELGEARAFLEVLRDYVHKRTGWE